MSSILAPNLRGTELAKVEVAFPLGKRYVQDEPLDFGCATERVKEDVSKLRESGHILRGGKPKSNKSER